MNPGRVTLMASAVGKIGGVTWHHLFVVGTDDRGPQACLRAGPETLPVEHSIGRAAQYGSALEDYEAPAAGRFGAIVFSSGPYEPGGVDFDPLAADVLLATGAAAAQLWEKLQHAARALQDERIAYDPVGRGGNWALMEALRRCGLQPALAPKRWAPGASLVGDPATPSGPTRRVGEAAVVV